MACRSERAGGLMGGIGRMGAAAAGGGAEGAAEIEPAAVPWYRQGGTGPPVLCIGACRNLPGYPGRAVRFGCAAGGASLAAIAHRSVHLGAAWHAGDTRAGSIL